MKGSEFRALREWAKLSQQRAAELLGVALSTVFRWEKLETVPRMAATAFAAIVKDMEMRETVEEKAAREIAQRKSTEAAWAALPPWSEEERQRRQRFNLPMNDGADIREATFDLYEKFQKEKEGS